MGFEPKFRRRYYDNIEKESAKRKVGRLKLARNGRMVVVYLWEEYMGQVFLNDLRDLLNNHDRGEVGIYQFKNRRRY